MKTILLAAIAGILALSACGPSRQQTAAAAYGGACTLDDGWKMSSPYLRGKLGCGIIGQPVEAAIAQLGAPDKSYTGAGGTESLTWSRNTNEPGFGPLACSETVTVSGGRITAYRQSGGSC